MHIKCLNIDDFCTLITTCAMNGIKDIRVFINEHLSSDSLFEFDSSEKSNKLITYVLFTPPIYGNI